eukprot:scaffold90313_cov34-Phaeocystis_antarctica.AAC.1
MRLQGSGKTGSAVALKGRQKTNKGQPEGEPYCDIPICHVPGTIRHCLARAWHGLARSGSPTSSES